MSGLPSAPLPSDLAAIFPAPGEPLRIDFAEALPAAGAPLRIDFAGGLPAVPGGPLRADFAGALPAAPSGPLRIDFAEKVASPKRAAPLLTRVVLIGVVLFLLSLGGVVSGNLLNSKSELPPLQATPAIGPTQTVGSVPALTAAPTKSGAPGASAAASAGTPPPSVPRPTPTSRSKATPPPTPGPKVTPPPTAAPKPVIDFVLTPNLVAGSCKAGLTSFQLKLDNTKSNVAVSWSLAFDPSPYPNGDWGTSKPTSGQVVAGQSATVVVTPATDLCSSIKTQTDFTLTVKDTGGSASITYQVSP
jgi:hypothetical protein